MHLILGQQGMKSSYELVHSCNHGLPVRETSLPFLVVVRIEDDVVALATVSHQVQILAQHCISMFGDSQVLAGVSRLVDARIGARKGDELLVGGELGDVRNLGEEVVLSKVSEPWLWTPRVPKTQNVADLLAISNATMDIRKPPVG